jgi:hypothetical protein
MKSISVAMPSAVVKRVSRMSEWPRYLRVVVALMSVGAMSQRP